MTCRQYYSSFRALMNRERWDTFCERGILALVLGILVFAPLATGAVRTPDFLIVQGLTAGVLLLWAARLWLNPKPRWLWPPMCWGVIAFTLYAVARYFTADIEYVARQEMIRVVLYAFLFFAILNNLHRQESMQFIVLTLVFLAMCVGGYAVYQYATGSNQVWNFISPYQHRGTGTFFSPNNCAGFLEMILPSALAWVLVSRASVTVKIFVGYAALVILAGLLATVSRGGWASTALTLLVLFIVLLVNRTYRLPALAVLIVLVAGAAFFIPRSPVFKGRFAEITKNNQFHSNARFEMWLPAIAMWQANPWWGVGPAHYDYHYRALRPVTQQLQPDRVHNDYLNTLADWGVVGFGLVTAAMALLAAGVLKTWRFVGAQSDLGGRRSNKFAIVLGAALGLLAILFHSLVDFNMHIPANAILAVTLMALLSGCTRFATDNYWFTAKAASKITATAILALGLAALAWQGTLRAREYRWLAEAERMLANPPQRIAALEKAFAIEPNNPKTAHALGEQLRLESFEGGEDFAELGQRAITWFERGMKLNPYDGYNFLRTGICLDWMEQPGKAKPFFDRAMELDPNGYFTAAWVGWHYVQVKDYAAAKCWFERSLHLDWHNNVIAESYLKICAKKMEEAATRTNSPLLGAPRP